MSFYRVWYFPLRGKACKHVYFRRDRPWGGPIERRLAALAAIGGEGVPDAEPHDGRFDSNLTRARRTIRDLAFCNSFDFFCTFTFNASKVDRNNFKECKQKITRLFDNYKQRYSPSFRYLVIPEFHRDGAVHFHGLVRGILPDDLVVPTLIWKRDKKTDELEQVPNTRKYVDWPYYSKKLGFFSCSQVRNPERCAWYVTKYITKDLADLPRGMQMVLRSKGLRTPELVFDEDNIPMIFKSDYADDFVSISYQTEQASLGLFLPPWHGECCADLHDPFENLGDNNGLGPRLTGSQLSIWRRDFA